MALQIAQDAHADQVLSESSFALLCGMLLDPVVAEELVRTRETPH